MVRCAYINKYWSSNIIRTLTLVPNIKKGFGAFLHVDVTYIILPTCTCIHVHETNTVTGLIFLKLLV